MTTAASTPALTIADLYTQPPLMRLWPDFGHRVCGMAESTTYQLAAENRLPVEILRIGRRKFVRTADVLVWLHLPNNSDAVAVAPAAASSEHIGTTAKQIGSAR
ncbi:DNA-binding protein [Streptomyces sp. NPDC058280]|uniref:DNA-binding protein n=1 Tax=Streptomyces sp. NPDC058280 TaxID=3346419 RepID=UPI0036F0BD40